MKQAEYEVLQEALRKKTAPPIWAMLYERKQRKYLQRRHQSRYVYSFSSSKEDGGQPMNRMIILLLALTILIGTLSACAAEPDPEPTEPLTYTL